MAKIGKRSEEVLDTLHPVFADGVEAALLAAPEWLDFACISGLRTTDEQYARWRQGRDADGNIIAPHKVVTYRDGEEKLSAHQARKGEDFSRAVDIVAYKGGRPVWDEYEVGLRAAYVIGFLAAEKGIQLTGGVRWGWDQAHLEMA